jgi:hypothetical protein
VKIVFELAVLPHEVSVLTNFDVDLVTYNSEKVVGK